MGLPIPANQLKGKLLAEGLITPEKFDALEQEAGLKNQSLLDILVSEHVADKNYLNRLIADFLGVEIVNFNTTPIDPEVVKLIPEEVSRQREILVFSRGADGSLNVAMADPSDLSTITYLSQHLGTKISVFLADQQDLNRGYTVYGSQMTSDFKAIIEKNIQDSIRAQTKGGQKEEAELPIVAVVDNIMSYAVSLRASDVHIEIMEDVTIVRYRIDGILYEIMRIPKLVHTAIVARIKILSGLKLDEHYEPQDGRFRHSAANQMVDVRVSILPTFYGEKMVMRLLEASQKPLSLEELGFLPEAAKTIRDNLKKTYGMILAAGPTGAGKTTTLYALMNILNKPNVNIVTIEDPIEYNMRYVNQAQVNARAGVTFASGLRAILRQDPNIIMVGEIRDKETANIAVQSALTGHLLLSSIHTNDAPTTIPRLFDLDVPPFLVGSVLNLVIAQRLVRQACKNCIYSYEPDEDTKAIVKKQVEELNIRVRGYTLPKLLYKGKGCNICNNTGYRGRLGIYEVFEVTENIRKILVSPQFDLDALRAKAEEEGMTTMFEDGLRKAELGMTTIEEVLRVIRE